MTVRASSASVGGNDRRVELVGLAPARVERPRRSRAPNGSPRRPGRVGQAQPDRDRVSPGATSSGSAPPPWCPRCAGIHRVGVAVDDVVVEAVLDVAATRSATPKSRSALVSFSVKSSVGAPLAVRASAGRSSASSSAIAACRPAPTRRAVDGAARRRVPRPGVAEPERRQHVQRRRLRAAVGDRDRGSGCRRRRPWRTRRRRRSSGRSSKTPVSSSSNSGSSRPRRRFSSTSCVVRERAPAGTCRGTSCRSASAWSRGRSSTP